MSQRRRGRRAKGLSGAVAGRGGSMLRPEDIAILEVFATRVTLALRGADNAVQDDSFSFQLNPSVLKGKLGDEYRRKSEAWFLGAKQNFARLMKAKIPLLNLERYLEACDAWEQAVDSIEDNEEAVKALPPEPLEADFCDLDFPAFKVGILGSIWVDVDLCGTVDGAELTKKTRVSLDPKERALDPPYTIVLDATFDQNF